MKHVLFVGYLKLKGGPRVYRNLDWAEVEQVLDRFCENVVTPETDLPPGEWQPIASMAHEKVYFRDGYLVCPWLGSGTSMMRKSVRMTTELSNELGCQVYCPDDGVFLKPRDLLPFWPIVRATILTELRTAAAAIQ